MGTRTTGRRPAPYERGRRGPTQLRREWIRTTPRGKIAGTPLFRGRAAGHNVLGCVLAKVTERRLQDHPRVDATDAITRTKQH